jgi:hypothetical protein
VSQCAFSILPYLCCSTATCSCSSESRCDPSWRRSSSCDSRSLTRWRGDDEGGERQKRGGGGSDQEFDLSCRSLSFSCCMRSVSFFCRWISRPWTACKVARRLSSSPSRPRSSAALCGEVCLGEVAAGWASGLTRCNSKARASKSALICSASFA